MKTLTALLFCLLLFSSCKSQPSKVNGFDIYNVGKIDSLESFMRYTAFEKHVDSISKIGDRKIDSMRGELQKQMPNQNNDTTKFFADFFANSINDFPSNRARVFISGVRNGKEETGDPKAAAGLPVSCKCYLNKDSVSVELAFGFGGGIAVQQQIVNSLFHTNISIITRHADIYKTNLSDKSFRSEISLKPLKESMTLLNRPTMHLGEQLTGFVTVQSQPYFQYAGEGKADTVSINVRYFFTCRLQKRFTMPDSEFGQ